MSSAQQAPERQVFVSRSAFILAAIGSAIGLGNIWRFPYVAYDSGGGAFIIPYLIALLTAGIPLLFVVYAIGHRSRSSAPLAYRSLHRAAEPIGWFKTGIATLIGIYYAVIVGWAVSYTGFSFTQAWGDDAEGFFIAEYLQQNGEAGLSGDFVPGVMIPLIIVWVICLVILYAGVQSGIARFSKIFVPLLVVVFAIMVVRSLFLPGAAAGLDALFTPDWSALSDPSVWIAAYGQIFFSLSIMFGIMLTYASYLKRKTNLTGSGLVVGFANSSFEMLAGVGVFAALGFMAHTAGTGVDEVVSNGVGLAFIAFPTIISQMPGGAIFGVLFFLTLIFAGLTSLVSIIQVPIAAIADKTGISERTSTVIVGGLMAVVSILIMPTATGLSVLDTIDAFTNNIGIVGIALTAIIAVGWLLVGLPQLRGSPQRRLVVQGRPHVDRLRLRRHPDRPGLHAHPADHHVRAGGIRGIPDMAPAAVRLGPHRRHSRTCPSSSASSRGPRRAWIASSKARAEFEAEAEAGTATGTSTARTRTLTSGGEKA